MIKTYRYRIYPTEAQKLNIEQHIGCCRLVWNLALEVKKRAYDSNKISVSIPSLQRQLTELKKETAWMYDVNAQSMCGVLLRLGYAYKRFFNGGGYPKFKKKSNHGSFTCHQTVYLKGNKLNLPKIGLVPIVLSRQIDGKIKTVTVIKRPSGKYFVSIFIQLPAEKIIPPPIASKTTIGIDVGIASFVKTSDGRSFEANRKLKASLKRLKVLSRRQNRKKRGSNRRKKHNVKLARLHEKIVNQRTDYIHKITTGLIRDNQTETFVIENLNVVGMLKNRTLSQAVSDVSFGEFFWQMKYKCDWYGKNLIMIGMFEPTSKKCSVCKSINDTLTLADREWVCANCGITHDRDFNAAINIKDAGLKQYYLTNSGRGTSGESVESLPIGGAKKRKVSK